jgi:hypothetical protein
MRARRSRRASLLCKSFPTFARGQPQPFRVFRNSRSVGAYRLASELLWSVARAICCIVAVLILGGCASSAPVPPTGARTFDDVHHIAIIVSGESPFALADDRLEPGRTLDEILKWHPYGGALRPIAKFVHRAINKVRDGDRVASATRHVEGVSPGTTVARSMARTLERSGWFREVRILQQEPTGESRPGEEGALVRIAVPAWGVIRVRDSDPAMVSGFADVQAHMMMGKTGVVVWEVNEDVTDPESAPLAAFVDNRDYARAAMVGVLEKAGQRLANELLYARGAGR